MSANIIVSSAMKLKEGNQSREPLGVCEMIILDSEARIP